MRLRKLATAVSAASLLIAPTLATAQIQTAPAPQVESLGGGSPLVDRGAAAFPWLPVAASVAALLVIYFAFIEDDDDDQPVSPG